MDKLEDTAKEENIEDPPPIRQDLVKKTNYLLLYFYSLHKL